MNVHYKYASEFHRILFCESEIDSPPPSLSNSVLHILSKFTFSISDGLYM